MSEPKNEFAVKWTILLNAGYIARECRLSELAEYGLVNSPGLRTNGGHDHPMEPVKNSSKPTHMRAIAVGQATLRAPFELRVSLPVSAKPWLSFPGMPLVRSKTSAIFGDWHIGTTIPPLHIGRKILVASKLLGSVRAMTQINR